MAHTSAADLAHSLKGAAFPMGKKQLADHARENGAPKEIIQTLKELPDGEYKSLADVEHGFGESNRQKRDKPTSEKATESARKGGHAGGR